MYNVLKNDNFRLAWSSYTVSTIATSIVPTVLALFIIDHLQLNVLGAALGFRTLGFILGAIFSGVITDHFQHRYVLISSSLIRCISMGMILLSLYLNQISLLCVIIIFLGIGEGFFRSAYQAVIADIISENERMAANAASTLSMRLSLTVVPLATTLLYTYTGVNMTLLLAVILWLGSSIIAFFLSSETASCKRGDFNIKYFMNSYKEGFTEALNHRWFIYGLGALLVWLSLSYSAQQLILPIVSKSNYGSNSMMGIALGCYSIGAILSSLIFSRFNPHKKGLIAFIALSFYGLVPLSLHTGHSLFFIYAAYFLGGIGIEAFNIPRFTAIQKEVPKNLIGRVSSFDFLVSYGISPLSLIALPYLIQIWGQSIVLLLCSMATIAASLLVLCVPGALTMHDPRRNNYDEGIVAKNEHMLE